MSNTQEQIFEETDVLDSTKFNLVLWNDDLNTFDWVIQSLCEVCKLDEVQAEQCSLIIHNRGKCAVKSGEYESLKPMCNAITERGIGATIEEMVH